MAASWIRMARSLSAIRRTIACARWRLNEAIPHRLNAGQPQTATHERAPPPVRHLRCPQVGNAIAPVALGFVERYIRLAKQCRGRNRFMVFESRGAYRHGHLQVL